jgi:RNA polymerase sigma factor (sigma-70 family)
VTRDPPTEAPASIWPPDLVAVYSDERAQLVRAAFLICGSVASAEDAVHDAVARVAKRWSLVDNGRSYLYVAAVNAARDIARREQRSRRFTATREWVADPDVAGLGIDSLALHAALARVPTNHRAALVLRFFLDWDDAEIAQHFGVRASTVRSWVHRGLARLRKEWDG